jgi:trehalose 6-phosphate phosphatase
MSAIDLLRGGLEPIALAHPDRTAFFLDVDGTLLGFKERPEDVVADEALRALLVDLKERAGGALALVSGRKVDDLDRIMAPLTFPAGGVHGADLRFADGRREVFSSRALTELRRAAEVFVSARPGLRIEDKAPSTFAIHYRAAPERGEEVAAFLTDAVTDDDLMVQMGKMVAEVKPSGCHKGLAIEALSATPPFSGRRPLFVGDDLTDEHGFQAVNAADGVSIKVGHESETSAMYRLADVNEVRDFLALLCR